MTTHRRSLLWLLAAYLLLTTAYAVVNPLFEAPDEHHHFYTAHAVATTGRLPSVPATGWDELMGQEAAQPPLYYVLAAGLLLPFDSADARAALWLNPFARLGDATALTNRNRVVPHPGAEAYAAGVYALRGLSVALGAGTLLCLHSAARRLWPGAPRRALLAVGLVAFVPQFNFLHSYSNNDALVIFLASAALAQLIDLWRRGVDSAESTRLLRLGLTIGLAMLTKMAGLLLLIYALGFLTARAWHSRSGRRAWARALALTAAPTLLTAGWLYGRNWRLYGDPFATEPFIRLAGGDRGYTLGQVLAESGGLWQSLFGVFGWFNVRPGAWFYGVWSGVVLLALLGAVVAWRRRAATRDRQQPWLLPLLLAGWPALVYAGMVSFMLRTPAAQGRLLLPAVVPLALGLTAGLAGWAPRLRPRLRPHLRGRFGRIAPLAAAVPGAALSLYCLLAVIRPAYALPAIVDKLPDSVDSLAAPVYAGIELVGAQVAPATVRPGDAVWLDLYWRADSVPPTAPEVVIELFGRPQPGDPGGTLGRLQTLHGGGLYPANLWKSGQMIHSRLGITLDAPLTTPTTARVNVRLVDGGAVDIALLKVIPPAWPAAAGAALATFDGRVEVVSAETVAADGTPTTLFAPGDQLTMRIAWRVLAPLGGDYTTFVHVGLPGAAPLAQGDAPPLSGFYPTRLWAAGENFVDNYTVDLPPTLPAGDYQLAFGLYDGAFGRLVATIDGVRQADDAVTLPIRIVDN